MTKDGAAIPPCPHCHHEDSGVLEKRLSLAHPGQWRRRRICHGCGLRFTTYVPFESMEPFEFIDPPSSTHA